IVFLFVLPRQFAFVQFPWRMLALSAFFASLGIAVFARCARCSVRTRNVLLACAAASVLLVPAFERTKWTEPDWTDATLVNDDALANDGGLGYTVLGEYLPREFDIRAYRAGDFDASDF